MKAVLDWQPVQEVAVYYGAGQRKDEVDTMVTGYSHPGCYAKALNDCSPELTIEHYVSKSILDLLGDVHVISNASWLASGAQSKPLPSSALGSKILCKRHNEMLSDVDARAKVFFEQILWAFSDTSVALPNRNVAVDGDALELWVLKACCGIFASGELLVQGRSAEYSLPLEWLRILFQGVPWTRNTGLHIRHAKATPHRGFAIGPVFSSDNNELSGGGIEFCGVELFVLLDPDMQKLIMETQAAEVSSTTYRPGTIDIVARTHKTTIELRWKAWQPTHRVEYRYE